jgi:hypothetical protein
MIPFARHVEAAMLERAERRSVADNAVAGVGLGSGTVVPDPKPSWGTEAALKFTRTSARQLPP